jgi:hypothetical protein
MQLRERHGAGFEPAIEDVRDPPHDRLAGQIVRIQPRELVEGRPVQIGRAHAEIAFDLVERTVDIDSRGPTRTTRGRCANTSDGRWFRESDLEVARL